MNFFKWLTNIDRRWLYLLMAIVVSFPLFTNIEFKVKPNRPVKDLYNYINNFEPGETVLLSFDYSPDSLAELNPMSKAVAYHAFKKDIRVIGIALAFPAGGGLGLDVIRGEALNVNREILEEKGFFENLRDETKVKTLMEDMGWDFDEFKGKFTEVATAMLENNKAILESYQTIYDMIKERGMGESIFDLEDKLKITGRDWTYFGYKAGYVAVILGMGDSIKKTLETDYKGTSISEYEMFQGNNAVKNYNNISLIVDFAAGASVNSWIFFCNTKYGRPVGAGVTAVMAADYYPYLQTGQLKGLMNGMRGAADYETLNNRKGTGTAGMTSQTFAHLLIIIFIILGNIGYFVNKKEGRK